MTDWTKQPTHKLILEVMHLHAIERAQEKPLGTLVTPSAPARELDRRLPPSPSRKPPKKRSQARRRSRSRSITCITCGAGQGFHCTNLRTQKAMKGVHPARRAP